MSTPRFSVRCLRLLARHLDRPGHEQQPLAIGFLDIDLFKDINDRHGHHVGDLVLREFVQRTLSVLRQADLLGRYGGEEFLLVLPEADSHTAWHKAETAHTALFSVSKLMPDVSCKPGSMRCSCKVFHSEAPARQAFKI